MGQNLYLALGVNVFLFVLGFFLPPLFLVAKGVFVMVMIALLLDFIILYLPGEAVTATRIVSDRLSNGDENEIVIDISNKYSFPTQVEIIDELPVQFQLRTFSKKDQLPANEGTQVHYSLRPTERGEYKFGQVNVFVKSMLNVIRRRFTTGEAQAVKVYPSFLQLRNYQLNAVNNKVSDLGMHKRRLIGHSMEFDHIKEYTQGDDVRTLNWKATARRGNLMVNSFMEEKSQQIYCVIDKGRTMKMPFEGLTLLDYAVNATLVFSSVALNKGDKAGLVTFADQSVDVLAASNKKIQLNNILEKLYAQTTHWMEADYERLAVQLRNAVSQRSLVILFTNFESNASLQRQMPYLRTLAKYHLLLVVFFENTELKKLSEERASDLEGIYTQVIAQKFADDKKLIARELAQYGIMSLLTTPQNLTVNVINRYLDLKSRNMV
ncbi:uncharacterized protein (DUF58 family) [Chitinophaga skermanii]|uniref:Uncharacterized protein (DUF58 family) n=1 Tax=Chitinophaga skermanii TaxID=331697 RepID=A0A327QBK5_9BACT|nr:uncharacterized protein (DUF58 family) [Chitinophaga skermanii]